MNKRNTAMTSKEKVLLGCVICGFSCWLLALGAAWACGKMEPGSLLELTFGFFCVTGLVSGAISIIAGLDP